MNLDMASMTDGYESSDTYVALKSSMPNLLTQSDMNLLCGDISDFRISESLANKLRQGRDHAQTIKVKDVDEAQSARSFPPLAKL